MAPVLRARQSLSKDRFSGYFANLRSQPYNDPNTSRGGSSHSLRSIAWNPLGTLIATGSVDKTLRVWNPEKPHVKFSTELKGHMSSVEKVAFNPTKDAELCSVSSDGVVKFWDVRTKACFNEVKGLGDAFTLAWAPDGETLLVGNKSDNIYVLSPSQSTPLASHQQTTQTNQISFCWSGEKVFVTTAEGRIRILSYPDFEPVLNVGYGDEPRQEFMLNGHTSSCLTAELQPTGRFLATGGSDSIIALWDTTDWIGQRTISRMVGPVRSISFTFDGSFIVGGSDEGNGLEVSHVETGEHVHTFKTAGSCPVVAWAPTRYCLAYGDLGVLRIVGVDVDRK
ncbi:WD40-repeat-containing domain protein [Stachybotrys elegans]|uniref:WD40-repeat-containing domain protein n=1 Tax=Stachybotrys elegans TaxID=80388 RepID=A0A8K0WWN1_9HYPO|nr:WD40-repeat-containing domain protein [Stachybotrys elegans]